MRLTPVAVPSVEASTTRILAPRNRAHSAIPQPIVPNPTTAISRTVRTVTVLAPSTLRSVLSGQRPSGDIRKCSPEDQRHREFSQVGPVYSSDPNGPPGAVPVGPTISLSMHLSSQRSVLPSFVPEVLSLLDATGLWYAPTTISSGHAVSYWPLTRCRLEFGGRQGRRSDRNFQFGPQHGPRRKGAGGAGASLCTRS